MTWESVFERAEAFDRADPLAAYRGEFAFDDPHLIYADGNSLGRLPRATLALADDLVGRQWGERLIRGWNEHWLDLPERLGARIAELIGADPDEVIVADSTTVNHFKLSVAALRARQGRAGIVSDALNFPSNLHSLQESASLLDRGHRLHLVASTDGVTVAAESIEAAIDSETALVSLSHVAFKSGYLHDMQAVTSAAHGHGALTLWDLFHSVGSVEIDLHAAGADLAVGCTYKYLNGGPGSPAFLYVRRDLQHVLANPIAGWMGSASMFEFGLEHRPAAGMRRYLTGTPPVLSLALMEPSIDAVARAGMGAIRAKSVALSGFLVELWADHLEALGYRLRSPIDPVRRGSHLSFGHDDGFAIDRALIAELGVLPDFRAPDNLRVGLVPLYTSFADVATLAVRLAQEVVDGRYVWYRGSDAKTDRPIAT